MVATAVSSVDGFLDRLAAELGSITDPSEAVVEGIAYTAEQIPTTATSAWSCSPARPAPSPPA